MTEGFRPDSKLRMLTSFVLSRSEWCLVLFLATTAGFGSYGIAAYSMMRSSSMGGDFLEAMPILAWGFAALGGIITLSLIAVKNKARNYNDLKTFGFPLKCEPFKWQANSSTEQTSSAHINDQIGRPTLEKSGRSLVLRGVHPRTSRECFFVVDNLEVNKIHHMPRHFLVYVDPHDEERYLVDSDSIYAAPADILPQAN